MKTSLKRHEKAILGMCEVFYHRQYTLLKHRSIHWMIYLLSRKNVSLKPYRFVWGQDGPVSAELEADLQALDEKQNDIMDFYDADLTIHAVSATYLASAECVREILELEDASNLFSWVETLASLSFLAESAVDETRIIVCNRYMMMKPNANYDDVQKAWAVLERAKMGFAEQ